jgi:hypothetical protein
VLFIYRRIPRNLDSLGWLAIFDTTPIGRFWGLLGAFMAAYNIKMLVSGYQSIDMHCIVLSVKFYGELSISVLRKKQLYKKNGRQHFSSDIFNFQTPPFEERADLGRGMLQTEPPGQNQSVYVEICRQ